MGSAPQHPARVLSGWPARSHAHSPMGSPHAMWTSGIAFDSVLWGDPTDRQGNFGHFPILMAFLTLWPCDHFVLKPECAHLDTIQGSLWMNHLCPACGHHEATSPITFHWLTQPGGRTASLTSDWDTAQVRVMACSDSVRFVSKALGRASRTKGVGELGSRSQGFLQRELEQHTELTPVAGQV